LYALTIPLQSLAMQKTHHIRTNFLKYGRIGALALWHGIRRYWQWGARLLVLWGCLTLLIPAEPRVLLDPPQTVNTTQPLMCVHTRFTDEVFEWKIQKSLQLMREMGADTIVEFFPWAYYEPSKGRYDWSQPDKIVLHAKNQGIRVIARIGLVPEWARPGKTSDFSTLNYLPEDSYDDFADFVAKFAARYAGTIDHIIVWNEPNLAFEWGFEQVNPAGYVKLLQVVYPQAKAANPNVIILAGALAPTIEPEGSANGLNDVLYLEQMYQAGAADYFDALAVHTYGFTDTPDAEPALDILNFRRAELLHDVMLEYDRPDKPVYITESGWNDHPRWTKAVRPSQRVSYTIDAYRYADANWKWLNKLCLWVWRYPRFTYSYPDNFMILGVGFERTPLFFALQALARGTVQEGELWLPPPVE
jgi:polysaccharide biosynthesis protein PslG